MTISRAKYIKALLTDLEEAIEQRLNSFKFVYDTTEIKARKSLEKDLAVILKHSEKWKRLRKEAKFDSKIPF